jgi:hypothetical protein
MSTHYPECANDAARKEILPQLKMMKQSKGSNQHGQNFEVISVSLSSIRSAVKSLEGSSIRDLEGMLEGDANPNESSESMRTRLEAGMRNHVRRALRLGTPKLRVESKIECLIHVLEEHPDWVRQDLTQFTEHKKHAMAYWTLYLSHLASNVERLNFDPPVEGHDKFVEKVLKAVRSFNALSLELGAFERSAMQCAYENDYYDVLEKLLHVYNKHTLSETKMSFLTCKTLLFRELNEKSKRQQKAECTRQKSVRVQDGMGRRDEVEIAFLKFDQQKELEHTASLQFEQQDELERAFLDDSDEME